MRSVSLLNRMKKLLLLAFGLAISVCALADDHLESVIPARVILGKSSAFNDGVWFTLAGQAGHQNCYYAPLNVSLFYAKPSGVVAPEKVLALLMTAKATDRTINVEYANNSATADFWGYGVSSCEIQRITLN